ncbi:MAG: Holliday junction branch migration protein RuvA [Alphaproteobacteria bacterium]|nr:MAG: Holliday junction branch migration protein RuvA [Alphaproteobacteria bacterium]
MIGALSGRVAYKAADHLLLLVGGVGYLVHCSDRTLAALAPGQSATLYTDLLVREDLLQLYGFPSLVEKEWHRLLMTVQGVGAKASMAVLGTLGPEGVSRAISLGDWAAVKAAPGVGPKLAQRIVNELKDKAPALMAMAGEMVETDLGPAPEIPASAGAAAPAPAGKPEGGGTAPGRMAAQADALSALVNLGYAQGEAAAAVAEAAGESPDLETAELIRAALKRLAPKG